MSHTPQSEQLDEEKFELLKALRAFTVKLRTRANHNEGEWSVDHRVQCNELATDLTAIQFRVEGIV